MSKAKHVVVYRETGRYAGWPANYGIWSWGNEIVVGFTVGYMDLSNPGMHAVDKKRPQVTTLARSLDGGETWETEAAAIGTPDGRGASAGEHMLGDTPDQETVATLADPPGNIEFQHPNFAMMCARDSLGEGARSWFYLSYDRCHSWSGPYGLPDFGTRGIAARTDYQVLGPRECMLFLTGKVNEYEGAPLCAATTDGGRSFARRSFVGPEPDGFSIMPASVMLPGGDCLVAVRRRSDNPPEGCGRNWIEAFRSTDGAATWEDAGILAPNTGEGGNPPTLTLRKDGKLCLAYGYRDAPFGLRGRVSEDQGATWSPEILLREDGGTKDIGYPRTALRPDGTLVTVYYFADSPETERYIAATLWRP